MRCPECNKFATMEMQDPEVDGEEYSSSGITASVRIVRTCADCSTELKEATFDVEKDVDFCSDDDEHEVTLTYEAQPLEEGGGRYQKAFFGATITFHLQCTCGRQIEVPWSDKIAAGSMDECV